MIAFRSRCCARLRRAACAGVGATRTAAINAPIPPNFAIADRCGRLAARFCNAPAARDIAAVVAPLPGRTMSMSGLIAKRRARIGRFFSTAARLSTKPAAFSFCAGVPAVSRRTTVGSSTPSRASRSNDGSLAKEVRRASASACCESEPVFSVRSTRLSGGGDSWHLTPNATSRTPNARSTMPRSVTTARPRQSSGAFQSN
mmetsp:Transcript_17051/g.52997  ORF Transcript_17051/g.52997 Transcript_17051/m.52997 type:complete len:201 (-) Transcript_17051:17-619(-)